MLICAFIGFSSGLPLWYLWQLIPYWLRTNGVSLVNIGWFALLLLPYSWKFVAAPILDRFAIPGFGRRRTWMLASQIALMLMIGMMGFFDPVQSLWSIAYVALAVACAGAIQDIAIDAYRRELLPDNELGLGSAIAVNAYRVAGLVSFSLAVYFSKFADWRVVHLFVAAFMLPGALCSLVVKEPEIYGSPPRSLHEAVVAPFKEFFHRSGGFRTAFYVLAFMLLYKFGDNLALALITPFYVDMGFTEEQIAFVSKTVALASMVTGGFIGGLIMYRIGINRSLWIFGVIQFLSIFGLAFLATQGKQRLGLGRCGDFRISRGRARERGFRGLPGETVEPPFYRHADFVVYQSHGHSEVLTGPIAGFTIEGSETFGFAGLGYSNFFLVCAVTAIPGMLLLFKVAPWNK